MSVLIEPKILKGTRDFLPEDMAKRNFVLDRMRRIFERFGYDTIETPVISYAETILGKYGAEGDRLTYNFELRGTKIALPYDLTVPFARLFAANYINLPIPFKRYQIQRVWRAERPQKGRLREFYQCDIDTIGCDTLLPEVEITRVITDVFEALGFEQFVIEINSRRLINDVLESFGLSEKSQEIIRVIDKLNKIGTDGVIEGLLGMGIRKEKAAQLLSLLTPEKTNEKTLKKLEKFDTSEIAEVLRLSRDFSVSERFLRFNPSMARGLDYYTGIIFEVTSEGVADLGSLCGGGRYDNLCGLFSKQRFSGVGVAFGFERIMLALETFQKLDDVPLASRVLVTLLDKNSTSDALRIYDSLQRAGINSELYFQPDKLAKQMKYADKKRIPFVVIRGAEERKKNEISIKAMKTGKQKTIPLEQLSTYLQGYE